MKHILLMTLLCDRTIITCHRFVHYMILFVSVILIKADTCTCIFYKFTVMIKCRASVKCPLRKILALSNTLYTLLIDYVVRF